MVFIFSEALSYKTSAIVKLILGMPLFIITFVFTLQVLISLFEPENIYSLNVISKIFTLDFLWQTIGTIIILGLMVLVLILIKKRRQV